ncbi:lactonase family protein [Paenibacillus sp. FA6]|uniref:lactonase family protein n=1 Tax=Paenibacillus sp. FA6 TaxID=3413029 RepID=UPI003F658CD0
MVVHDGKLFVFVGSYAKSADSGIYVYSFDEGTGKLTLVDEVAGLENPTFLNVDINRDKLYAISETKSAEGTKIGEVVEFAVDPTSGGLKLINRMNSVQSTTCHIQRDSEGKYLTVTSYHGGMIGLLSLKEDGSLGELLDVAQHVGKGVLPERQDRPHPHSSFFSPDGRFLFVQDLGLDLIQAYSINEDKQQLIKQGIVNLQPAAGPRHLTFHPNGAYAFVINEIDSTITSFNYDAENGRLSEQETVPTLPVDFVGDNGCAEILISQDGKFVYGSNRGHDSMVVYAFDEVTGKLTLVEHVSVEGAHPRHFEFTPKGDYLIVANRDTDNLTVFRVNQESGRLQYTGESVTVSKPVCVKPFYL